MPWSHCVTDLAHTQQIAFRKMCHIICKMDGLFIMFSFDYQMSASCGDSFKKAIYVWYQTNEH